VRRIIAAAFVLVVVFALVVAQLLLPGIAASRLRSQLSKDGRVQSVSVTAFPAVELLWHRADTVSVRMASYSSATPHLEHLLGELREARRVTVQIGTLRSGRLLLEDVRLQKRAAQLFGSAQVSEAALRSAYPLSSVTFVRSGDGQLTLRGAVDLLGLFSGRLDASIRAESGRLVVVPDLALLGGVLTVTVFSDPAVVVEGVGGAPIRDGLELRVRALLR
jgi:hypothetical protein